MSEEKATYLENKVESLLSLRAAERGGIALKQTGIAGIPDRLVLLPRGRMIFVELKRPGEKPRKLQIYWLNKLERMGFETAVLDSTEGVEEFMREL